MTTMTRPTSRRRRRIGVLAAGGALTLALGLSACGGDDTAAPSAGVATSSPATQLTAFEAVKASAQNSRDAGSAKFSLTTTATGEAAAAVGQISADGAFDSASGAVEMTMTLPAEAGGTKLTMRLVDEVAYLSGAPLTAEGQWVRVPLDAMGATGLDTTTMDPSKQLEQLQGVAEDVRELPAQDVRGVQAKGYAGTIDPVKAIEQLPAEQQTPEAKDAAAKVGPIPFELYVDEEDRPVRMTQTLTVEGSTMKVQMDFFDWGSDVDVAAPDPATVTEMPGMAGMAGQTGEATPAPAGA